MQMKTSLWVVLPAAMLLPGCVRSQTVPAVGLHQAAVIGNVQVIRQHIDAGTDLDAKDPYGSTPLIAAVTFGRTDAARTLIDGGADLGISNSEGSSPLHIAAFLCYSELVELLLERGADPEATNIDGHTPLDGVAGPFDQVRGVYDAIGGALGPLGLTLDYEHLKATRPVVADMLRSANMPDPVEDPSEG